MITADSISANGGGSSGTTLDAYANVTVSGSTPSIVKASSNVTSITDRGIGRYTINMDALASANYTAVITANGNSQIMYQDNTPAKTTTAFPLASYYPSAYGDISFYVMMAGA